MARKSSTTWRKKAKRAEASRRAEAKVLAVGAGTWAPFPGSGVQWATLARLRNAGRVIYEAGPLGSPVHGHFTTVVGCSPGPNSQWDTPW